MINLLENPIWSFDPKIASFIKTNYHFLVAAITLQLVRKNLDQRISLSMEMEDHI